MDIATKFLVGRVHGRHYSVSKLQQWFSDVWGDNLKEISKVQTLEKGWFALQFSSLEHTNWVLSMVWHLDLAPVLLCRWTPLFDPARERADAGPIWVRLLGLPLHFWIEDVFRHIANALDIYLTFDDSYQTSGKLAYARILVHLDLFEGFLEFIDIHWRNHTIRQLLDYEGVPFRCR